jgi:hypothetical protein
MSNGISTEQRIAAVLAGDAIAAVDLSDLIAETDNASSAADATAEAERTRALDPARPVDPATAHTAIANAALVAQRMRAAMPRLQARLDEITAQEYAATWREDYAAVEAASDELATQMNGVYAAFVEQFTELMSRVAACDQQVAKINIGAPSGESRRLRVVELQGRKLDRFTRAVPSITDDLKLPPWQPGGQEWPVRVPFSAAMAAAIAPRPFDRRFSPDWWQVKQEEEARVREQQVREAAEREAKALENYRGPRWWEKERA